MNFSRVFVAAAATITTVMVAAAAHADPVTATLSATYYQVAGNSGDQDFNIFNTPNVALGSTLGPDGLPVVTMPNPGINDVGTGNQITWWSPTLNSNVQFTANGTITLPYSSTMYAPNSTGTNDGTEFETAVFKGVFDLSSPSTVSFSLGSDDDTFIYVDGVLIGQNPGVHATTDVAFTSGTLGDGDHNIEVFYADRHQTGAELDLSLLSDGVTITAGVPEPATWAMMLVGIGGLGAMLRRRKDKMATRVA